MTEVVMLWVVQLKKKYFNLFNTHFYGIIVLFSNDSDPTDVLLHKIVKDLHENGAIILWCFISGHSLSNDSVSTFP